MLLLARRTGILVRWLGVVAWLSLGACSNKAPNGVAPPRDTAHETPPPPPPPELLRMYDEAADLDPLRLMPLASHEGMGALLAEAAREPKHRKVVLAALPYTGRLAAAEYLAMVVESSEPDRAAALDALGQLAARANRNEDSEDVLELRRGCEALDRFVAAGKGKAEDRARAESAVRALTDFGCVAPKE